VWRSSFGLGYHGSRWVVEVMGTHSVGVAGLLGIYLDILIKTGNGLSGRELSSVCCRLLCLSLALEPAVYYSVLYCTVQPVILILYKHSTFCNFNQEGNLQYNPGLFVSAELRTGVLVQISKRCIFIAIRSISTQENKASSNTRNVPFHLSVYLCKK
jgi:hypothetical protein